MKKALVSLLALFILPSFSMASGAPPRWQSEIISHISHQRFIEAGETITAYCVEKRVSELSDDLGLNAKKPEKDVVEKVVTIFRELRSGVTLDNKEIIKAPTGVMSTAEAISLLANSMALAASFGDGTIAAEDVAAGLQGAIVKDEEKDNIVWKEYINNILKKRGESWRGLYNACKELNS